MATRDVFAACSRARKPKCAGSPLTLASTLFIVCILFFLVSPERKAHSIASGFPALPLLRKSLGDKGLFASVDKNGDSVVSFWHDVEFSAHLLDKSHVVPMVVEIPKGTTAKFEINKEARWNPILQDMKNGKPRFYPFPSVFHYGAIPRSYEHPKELDFLTELSGDGDPVDIVDISDMPAVSGDIYWVRILGALAMEDDGAADWKIVAIRLVDPRAEQFADLSQVLDVLRVQRGAVTSAPVVTTVPKGSGATLPDAESGGLRHVSAAVGAGFGKKLSAQLDAFRIFFARLQEKKGGRPRPRHICLRWLVP